MIDIAQITALAGSGTGILVNASQIAENLKKTFGSAEPDVVASKQLVLELLGKLIDAQRNQFEIEKMLAELQKQLDAADRFAREAARYELSETDMGGRVNALKANDPSGEPPHEICANCYENGKNAFFSGAHRLSTPSRAMSAGRRC